jgi:fibronectin-binding autotransporter adhesin
MAALRPFIGGASASETVISGVLSGSAGFLHGSNTGIVTLTNDNSFSGTIGLRGGTLRLTNFNAMKNASFFTGEGSQTNSSATVELRSDTAGTFATAGYLAGGDDSAQLTINADRAVGGSGTNQTLTLGGTMQGATQVNFTGGNGYRVGLATVSMFTGTGRTLTLNPTTANVTVATINPPSGNTIKLDGTSSDNIVTGNVGPSNAGGFNLQKTNTSTWTLKGTNTSGGANPLTVAAGTLILDAGSSTAWGSAAVAVNGGTLRVNGTLSNATTVATTGTLDGTGTTGAVTVNAGGTLAPGSGGKGAIGTGNLLLPGTLSAEISKAISGSQPVSGTDYDRVNVTGTVNLTGGDLTLSIGTGLEVGDLYFLAANNLTDAITGTFTSLNGSPTTLTQGSEFTIGDNTFAISYTGDAEATTPTFTGGNDLALMVVIPEPQTWAMLLGGFGMLLGFQRARRVRR